MKTWELDRDGNKSDLENLVERFTAGPDTDFDLRLAKYDIYGSIAHVYGLEELELITASEATRLRNELRNLLEEEIELSPEDEDVHTKVENELTERLGDLGGKLHTARSRNDQVLVDVRLYTKARLFQVVQNLLSLAEALLDFADEWSETPMVGYTHSRKAMPSSVGLWAGAYAESLLDDLLPLDSAFELIDRSPLGVGAGYGVPVKLDRKLTADLLGFGGIQNNAISIMNSRGKFELSLVSGFAGIQIDVSRMAEDLITFTGQGFNYFALSEPFTTGSSIMPQKENPDVLELVRGRAAGFSGYISSLYNLLTGLRSGYSRDLQETKGYLMRAIDDTDNTLGVLVPLIEGLGVNEEELLSAFTEEVLATDRVFGLVNEGEPFRSAYRKVKESLEAKESGSSVSEDKVRKALSSRNHEGGPGHLNLEKTKNVLEEDRAKWEKRRDTFQSKLEKLGTPENT